MSKLDAMMVKDGHLGGYIPGGDPGTWCPALWSWAMNTFHVRSILDVGCGEGHSAKFFLDHGCDVHGVEGCERAIRESVIPGRVVHHDYTAGPWKPSYDVDLVWSCEFLEHVEERYVPNILASLGSARKAILVTHGLPHQTRGHHHVNLQTSAYWIRKIEKLGFTCDVKLTLAARTESLRDFVGINHFAKSGLVFTRRAAQASWLGTNLQAHMKDWRINLRFKLSWPYWQQKVKKHAARRAQRNAD